MYSSVEKSRMAISFGKEKATVSETQAHFHLYVWNEAYYIGLVNTLVTFFSLPSHLTKSELMIYLKKVQYSFIFYFF